MHAGFIKINFEADTRTAQDVKTLKQLAENISINYDVTALGSTATLDRGDLYVAVACLSHVEGNIEKKFDQILDFCEKSGFGRIEDETRFLDSIDAMDMDMDEDDDGDDDDEQLN